MGKPLLLFFIVVWQLKESSAQSSSSTFKRFGFKAGVNVINMNFNKGVPPPAARIESGWKPGFAIGAILRVPVKHELFVQTEYLYSYVSGQDKSTAATYRLNYLSMPVLLKYQAASKLALEAGPQFDLLIAARRKTGGVSMNITHDTEERNFGIVAGLEIKVIKEVSIDFRYMNGINHVGIGQRSNVKEFKFEQFQMTTALAF